MEKSNWILCPTCNGKTRTQIRRDTVMTNFPLFCPKCKQVALVNVNENNLYVIDESVAEVAEPII